MSCGASGGGLQVQPFGTSAGGTLAGANLMPWTATYPPSGKYTVVQTRGAEMPVAVSAAAALGTALYPPSTSAPGVAATSAQTTGAAPVGIVSDTNSGSASQVYVQTPGA